MCEAFLRAYAGDRFDVASAGIEAGTLNPLVVKAMAEIGVGMEGHYAKKATEFLAGGKLAPRNADLSGAAGVASATLFDYVITVCDETAAERCPMFPGKHVRLHWGFPDPAALTGTDEEKLAGIRPIRDAIKAKILQWIDEARDA